MFLNSPEHTWEVSFRVTHGESSFMIYASTDSIRCFECGDLGHKRFTCPHKNEQTNNIETPRSQERVIGVTDEVRGQQEVSELNVNIGDVEKPGCSTAVEKVVYVMMLMNMKLKVILRMCVRVLLQERQVLQKEIWLI